MAEHVRTARGLESLSRRADCSARANASTATPCPLPQYEGRDLRHLFTSVGMHRSVESVCCDLSALFPRRVCHVFIGGRREFILKSLIIDSFESTPSSFRRPSFSAVPTFSGSRSIARGFSGWSYGARHVDGRLRLRHEARVVGAKLVLSRQRTSRLTGSLLIQVDASVDHRTTCTYDSCNLWSWNRALEPAWARSRRGDDTRAPRNVNRSRFQCYPAAPTTRHHAQKQRGRPAREVEAQM